jgi:hypothetical protein
MDKIEKYVIEAIQNRNNSPVDDFEGYSPDEMQVLLYDFFNVECVVQLKKNENKVYDSIPFLNQIKFLCKIIAENKELTLTKTGRLPVKTVAEIYNQGNLKEDAIEKGFAKLYKEEGVPTIELTRIILELSQVVKKRNNKLSITAKGKKLITNNHLLFLHIFEVFVTKFNWGYFDGYENEDIGQLGFGFSLILLDKYGSDFKSTNFYSNKYFKAFSFETENINLLTNNKRAYPLRTFDRFLEYFGLVKMTNKSHGETSMIKTTGLFKQLIHVRPHNKM